ncbi:MAG: type VI secretion system ATPase TssH [Gammaproteobacteria bacterium]|nr:type VI secretion system ATPase TssH [Gammaproteobacteria bacterium]MDH5727611.1 type VI secretion system ATPase TssH [Gammaproteobacteria bacterium]
MANLDIRALIGKLNNYSKQILEQAAGVCVSKSQYEVTVEHFLLQCMEHDDGDVVAILKSYECDVAQLKRQLQRIIENAPSGNTRKPVFSRLLMDLLEEAWLFASVELEQTALRSGHIFVTLLGRLNRYALDEYYDDFKNLPAEEIKQKLLSLVTDSVEEEKITSDAGKTPSKGDGSLDALNQFAINFTEQARRGEIDPVFGREREIRQMVDILARRRKNNPIVVGEPGVGKTAVVEGLALKIVQNDVPDVLSNVELYSLDLGLLQAGASVKGQFEQRLNAVITEVKSSPKPIILFIDEAHTLIGAGGAAGGGDAANLLKPALARGELRTVAATTWSEYKKYFEKDAALARRFQLVKVEEPDIDNAVLIMRGLRENYEKAHDVYIRDDAVVATAELAERYISGRQLPDKSVDLMDTACARVKISLSSKPDRVNALEKDRAALERELNAIERDKSSANLEIEGRIDEIKAALQDIESETNTIMEQWKAEKELVDQLLALRKQIAGDNTKTDVDTESEEAPVQLSDAAINDLKNELSTVEKSLAELQQGNALIDYEVTPDTVGKVVSDWTGIPVGDMIRDEANAVLHFQQNIENRIKGQGFAIHTISERIKASKAGLNNPHTPLGVFLLVGPSGVGKTETGLALADLLFGGERFICSINMSEFQEKHTVSRLVGSPPGYVGYGEGGVLTEAVRQRPYSVVLLDEVEKADLEVMNLFYQVFDKGVLSDGEGRVIDFKNTIVMLTSNLASDIITEMCSDENDLPTLAEISEAIRPVLSHHFKPALLARMEIVPFIPIQKSAMADIVRIKLNKLVKLMMQNQKINLLYDDAVVQQIAQRCTEVETGARNIDYIVNNTILPRIANEILQGMAEETKANTFSIGLAEDGNFTYNFHQG